MATKLSLLAQSRSIDERDAYVYENTRIDPEDSRTLIIEKLISEVTSTGRRYKSDRNVEYFIYKNRFVIYVRPVEKDKSGRGAPIACYGEIDVLAMNDTFEDDTRKAITEFSASLHRTIEQTSYEAIQLAVSDIKKKRIQWLQLLSVSFIIGLIIVSTLIRKIIH